MNSLIVVMVYAFVNSRNQLSQIFKSIKKAQSNFKEGKTFAEYFSDQQQSVSGYPLQDLINEYFGKSFGAKYNYSIFRDEVKRAINS